MSASKGCFPSSRSPHDTRKEMHMECDPRPQVFLRKRMKFNRYVSIFQSCIKSLPEEHRAEALP